MTGQSANRIIYDEAKLKQLEDDDPGINWLGTIRHTLPLVNGTRARIRAVGTLLLRLLP